MKKIIALMVLPISLMACGDDEDPPADEAAVQQIQACIGQGGDPQFTTDSYGKVREFLGCKLP